MFTLIRHCRWDGLWIPESDVLPGFPTQNDHNSTHSNCIIKLTKNKAKIKQNNNNNKKRI